MGWSIHVQEHVVHYAHCAEHGCEWSYGPASHDRCQAAADEHYRAHDLAYCERESFVPNDDELLAAANLDTYRKRIDAALRAMG